MTQLKHSVSMDDELHHSDVRYIQMNEEAAVCNAGRMVVWR